MSSEPMTPEQATVAMAALGRIGRRLEEIARSVDGIRSAQDLTDEHRRLMAERYALLDERQAILERGLGKETVRHLMTRWAGVF